MPRQIQFYEPDAIDCNTLIGSLANDFGVLAEITTSYGVDKVETIVRCWKYAPGGGREVQVQALVSNPLKSPGSLYVQHYKALLDCWHQLDRGVLAAAARPIERGWNGRPRTPERRGRK